jgi:hypothetical protein
MENNMYEDDSYSAKDDSPYYIKPGEKIFNDWNPMFMLSDSACVWMLIVDGVPKMRTESIYMFTDEKVKDLSDNGYELWKGNEL